MCSGTVPCSTSTRCSSPSSSRTRGSFRARMPAGCSSSTSSCVISGSEPIDALRQRLHHEVVAVAIDDQRRQQVGFAVHEAVRGGVDVQRLAKAGSPAASRARQSARSTARVAARQQAQRDFRSIAEERLAERRPRVPTTATMSPRRGVGLGDVGLGRSTDAPSAHALFARDCEMVDDGLALAGIIPSLMRIAIGADHAGFALKQHSIGTLGGSGTQVDDRGTHSDAPVDYPPICADVARQVADGTRRPRHRHRRQRPGRADGRQQGARRPRGAVQRSYTRRGCRASTTTPTSSRSGGRIVAIGAGRRDRRVVARDAVRGRPPSAPHRSDRRARTRASARR